uniref:Uncharacterized protein n=1 Tax=viral metagenome TaxID=1070528 RepID=A0A6C0KSC4_9ZZZZ
MEQKYPNLKYIKTVLIIAGISYAFAFITYSNKIMESIHENNIYMIIAHFLLIVSFGILTYSCFKHAIKNKYSEDISPEFNVLGKPGIYGYTLLSIYFMLALLVPFGLYFNYYYVFALLGYTLLAFKEISGVYLLVIFYICSIFTTFYYTKIKNIDTLALLSKVGLILYFGTYGYINIVKIL